MEIDAQYWIVAFIRDTQLKAELNALQLPELVRSDEKGHMSESAKEL